MADRRTDANPDTVPDDNQRGSIESIDQPGRGGRETPDPRNGAVGGTDGETKNQGDDAQ